MKNKSLEAIVEKELENKSVDWEKINQIIKDTDVIKENSPKWTEFFNKLLFVS